jgi:hypothetical protein
MGYPSLLLGIAQYYTKPTRRVMHACRNDTSLSGIGTGSAILETACTLQVTKRNKNTFSDQ